MLINTNNETILVVWVSKIVLLFQMHVRGDYIPEKYCLLQKIESKRRINNVDEVLGCGCLRRATKDEIDITMPIMISPGHYGLVLLGKWFGTATFAYIQEMRYVNNAKFSLQRSLQN